MPIQAVEFSEEIDKSMYIGDVLNKELKIYVTPTEFFTTKFREPTPPSSVSPQVRSFYLPRLFHNEAYTVQDTTPPPSSVSPQVRSFYLFHVYFTMRRILYEIGGIESVSALPDDPTFKQRDNKYQSQPTKESVVSSVLTQALTSASQMEKTTGLAPCTFGLHIVGLRIPITTIQTLI